MALIGYARVSTEDQVLDRQIDALKSAGCGRIYSERVSSDASRRKGKAKESPHPPQLQRTLDALQPGDILVVQSLDRLTRDGPLGAFVMIDDIAKRGVSIRVLDLAVDTSTPMGEMVLSVVAYVARIERDNLRKRTVDGLAAARRRGKVLGRPRRVNGAVALQSLADLAVRRRAEGASLRSIAREAGIGYATLVRNLDLADAEGLLPAGWREEVAAAVPATLGGA